jgi:hypothetical protein
MKMLSIACALGFGFALALSATAAEPKAATHSAHKTLTGCLEKGDTADTYKLTHVTGGGDWELLEAPASLKIADHVGHKVEVMGTAMSAAAAEKAEKSTAKEEKGENHLKVTGLKHVSPTCP